MGNAFLTPDRFDDEYFYHMKVAVCESCCTLQVIDIPDPDQMFHENYAYFAGTSQYMSEHFRVMSEKLMAEYVSKDSLFVVEIGCNDGISLQNFARAGIPHLGVEPSANVAQAARDKGINVESGFFNVETAQSITERYGHADLFIATNTMHHIEDINSVAAGVEILLKPDGVMVQEDPYLGDMLELVSYDQLYAEHMYIWSITSLGSAFGRHGLEIFDIERNNFHGGCMRYYLCRKGGRKPTERFLVQQAKEDELGLKRQETYVAFRKRCESARDRLVERLETYCQQGKRVVGYGATAKSATIINYCGLTTDHIAYISDTTPTKQGKFSPGAHIPIVPPDVFTENYPDYAVLFAWNHFDEINAKEKRFVESGGKWMFPIGMIEEK